MNRSKLYWKEKKINKRETRKNYSNQLDLKKKLRHLDQKIK